MLLGCGGRIGKDSLVGYNFLAGDRDQLLLMPPSVADWLPSDHLAWFVLDVVSELELTAFRAGYRADGRGGAAYHPELMLAVLIYAYCVGERSSRRVERRLVEDVAFRVVAANQRPDHATLARFRVQHQEAIADLFGQVLVVCARAGMLRSGLVAIDGTKLAANASARANRTVGQLTEELAGEAAEEVLAQAAATDAAEDAAEAAAAADAAASGEDPPDERLRQRGGGRRARLRQVLAELQAEQEAKSFDTHMAKRAAAEQATGARMGGRAPKATSKHYRSRQRGNVTDPDSRLLKTRHGYRQGYNAQAVATTDQLVVAAEVTNHADDAPAYGPTITAAKRNVRACGGKRVRRVVADAGYWSKANATLPGVESFIAPTRVDKLRAAAEADQHRRDVMDRLEAGDIDRRQAREALGLSDSSLRGMLRRRQDGDPDSATSAMIAKLDTTRGRDTYRKRSATIEPVFAQVKHNRGITRLSRRGLAAADSEWKLICATHNLLKMWRATQPAPC